ncbi:hypothetical protein LQW54_011150 [Pestalotiopsis sp. IQ-011]
MAAAVGSTNLDGDLPIGKSKKGLDQLDADENTFFKSVTANKSASKKSGKHVDDDFFAFDNGPHDTRDETESHFEADIRNARLGLNTFNTDLSHILTKLLHGQNFEIYIRQFQTVQYNLRATDYNATLPDRDTPIMPLKNPQTGHIIPEFLNEDTEKPLTIQALEGLSARQKIAIMHRLGINNEALVALRMEEAEILSHDEENKERREKRQALQMERRHVLLIRQLRLSIGLSRTYCPSV